MFSTSELVNQINQALATGDVTIPNGHKLAVIVSAKLVNGQLDAQAVVAMKLGDQWHISNVLDWNHAQGVSEGVSLTWSK